MNESKDSRFEDKIPAIPPPTGLRASNTLESLRPREVTGYSGPDPFKTYDPVQKADISPLQGRGLPPEQYNLLQVDWPAAMESMGAGALDLPKETIYGPKVTPPQAGKLADPVKIAKPSYVPRDLPAVQRQEDRIEKLEGQVDEILDRLAKFSIRSSHKI